MPTISRRRWRLTLDAAKFGNTTELLTNTTPKVFKGNDLQIEGAVFDNGVLQSVANLSYLRLEGYATLNGTLLFAQTINAVDLDDTVDSTTWTDGSKEHVLFTLTNAQLNQAASPTCWLLIYAVTTDVPGREITLFAGNFTIVDDGGGSAESPPDPVSGHYTTAESDARYLQPAHVPASGSVLLAGELAVDAEGGYYYAEQAMQVLGLRVTGMGTAPTGAALQGKVVDESGTELVAAAELVAAGAFRGRWIFASPLTLAAGDELALKLTQVGSSLPGAWLCADWILKPVIA